MSRVRQLVAVTAVPAESAALLDRLPAGEPVTVGPYRGARVATPAGSLLLVAGGVGPAAAAACAGTVLALVNASLVLSVGVAGGFAGRAGIGEVVVADAVVHADLGAGSPQGFLSVAELGFGETRVELGTDLVDQAAARVRAVSADRPPVVGPVLTVCTVTGTDERAAELARRYAPVAEAMEGAGVLAAARVHSVPFLEIRGVSNPVGRRERAGWNLVAALNSLATALAAVLAEPL